MLFLIIALDWTKAIFSNYHQEKLIKIILIPLKELESACTFGHLENVFIIISKNNYPIKKLFISKDNPRKCAEILQKK